MGRNTSYHQTWNVFVPGQSARGARWPAGKFALRIEGLERFVRKEPLRCTHECVFGVLALESEPVDWCLSLP